MTQTHRRFGVEQEQFILHDDGTPPSHGDMDEFYALLREQGHAPTAHDAAGRILAVERATQWGALVVANDGFTHILEVAFPPLRDLNLFRQLYLEEFSL